MCDYTHQNSSATQKVMTRSGQISGSLRMVANSCSPKNKGRDNDTLFMLIPETMETFWLLSLKYHPAIFFNRQGAKAAKRDKVTVITGLKNRWRENRVTLLKSS